MLSKQSLEILLDLVEIKLSAIMILDKDDVRELQKLKNCRSELLDFKRTINAGKKKQNGGSAAAAMY